MYKHNSIGNGLFAPSTTDTVTDGVNALSSNSYGEQMAPYIETANLSPQDEQVIAQHWKLSPSFSVPQDNSVVVLARMTTPVDHSGIEELPLVLEISGTFFCPRESYFQGIPVIVYGANDFSSPTGKWYPSRTNDWFAVPCSSSAPGHQSVNATVILRHNLDVPLWVGWAIHNGTSSARSLYAATLMMSARYATSRVNTFERSY